MASYVERATIGDALEIPRIINGLWQLSGEKPSSAVAEEAMGTLFEVSCAS